MLFKLGEILTQSKAADTIKSLNIPILGSAFVTNLLETVKAVQLDVFLTIGLAIIGLITGGMTIAIKLYERREKQMNIKDLLLHIETEKIKLEQEKLDLIKIQKEINALDKREERECAEHQNRLKKKRYARSKKQVK